VLQEVGVEHGKKAIVVFVPYKQHSKYKKIQARLIRELEKKLARHVVVIAQRTILSKNVRRPYRCPTHTHQHDTTTRLIASPLRSVLSASLLVRWQFARGKPGQVRPRSRTLTSVHNAILEDLVYPVLIVAKRMRVKLDGSRLVKVYGPASALRGDLWQPIEWMVD
jgi:small subunit ribosomal protein S7e